MGTLCLGRCSERLGGRDTSVPSHRCFLLNFVHNLFLNTFCLQLGSRNQTSQTCPPLSASTHTYACFYDVSDDPGLPAAPSSCPTFQLQWNKISLLISCAAVSRGAPSFHGPACVHMACKASSALDCTVYLPHQQCAKDMLLGTSRHYDQDQNTFTT